MRKEYIFKGGVRGKFAKPRKVRVALRIDLDVLEFFKKLEVKEGIPYQSLINLALRKFAAEGGSLTISSKG